jgi:hypothetical protein
VNRGRQLVACVVLAVGAASCLELSVDPEQLSSIEFLAPTSPSIVAGDVLRDTLGAPEPLRARAFAADGDELPDLPFTFVATDSLVRIESGNQLRAGSLPGTARLYVSVPGLQSAPRSLEVIRKPDSIAASGKAVDTVRYTVPSSGSRVDSSMTVGVVVRAGSVPVNAVRVRFEIWRNGARLAPTDTTIYALAGTSGRISVVDTTDGSGIASRTLRVPATAGTTLADSLEVRAFATGLPTPLTRSLTILVRPAQ